MVFWQLWWCSLFDFVDLPNAAAQPSEYFSFVPIRKIVMIFSSVSIQFL